MEPACNNYGLTPRQREVVELLAQGFSHKEIGARLFLATSTVKQYVADAKARFGANTTIGLVTKWRCQVCEGKQ